MTDNSPTIDAQRADAETQPTALPSIQSTRMRVVATARGYIGTPWAHTARLKYVGVDCVGLLVCVSRELGFDVHDFVNYTYSDEFENLIKHLEIHVYRIDGLEFKPGDIMVFRGRMMYNHAGYATERNSLIHAYQSPGINKVVETPLDTNWIKRLHSVYRYVGIED